MNCNTIDPAPASSRGSMLWVGRARRRGMLLAMFAFGLPATSLAQDADLELSEIIVLGDLKCIELMGQSGEDRDRSVSFLQGFVLGGMGQGEFTLEQIIDAEEVFFDVCLNNPNDLALGAMQSAHGLEDE